ncbi:hypothetical protein [uncultured Mobiluncus sp.]|uniref:hypothetical protein n=1 Tax=uncultured Mobiluncus sp. TaxID=293425 RepID=UPI00260E985F|nr:hypothetical protein [uncultured Mobiluncus sp.]
MKLLRYSLGFLAAFLLSITPLAQATSFNQDSDSSIPITTHLARACPEIGHHGKVSNVYAVFMPGTVPKSWLDPGASYSYESGRSTTVTGTVSGGVDATFWGVVHASINASLAKSNTATVTQTWTWTNNTNSTQWVQLGARGYTFDYESYDVVAPCNIVNVKKMPHNTLPTNETWIKHS